jgi:hypothetical protein
VSGMVWRGRELGVGDGVARALERMAASGVLFASAAAADGQGEMPQSVSVGAGDCELAGVVGGRERACVATFSIAGSARRRVARAVAHPCSV